MKKHWHQNGMGWERKTTRGWHGMMGLDWGRLKIEDLVGGMSMGLCLLMCLQLQMGVV